MLLSQNRSSQLTSYSRFNITYVGRMLVRNYDSVTIAFLTKIFGLQFVWLLFEGKVQQNDIFFIFLFHQQKLKFW